MYKSTSDKASSEGALIGKRDVGKRVIVGRVGAGTLMYVGPVEGKDGIFCGVELDRPEGKHDGSYQGIAYFHCAPQHGIFAPSYKVELLQEVRIASRREQKLVRSAMPAIAGSDMVPSTAVTASITSSTAAALRSTTPSMDVSMASMSSLGSSSIFDHSMIMSGSWNSDAMVNSQATYTVAGPGDRSRYQLLEEIECPGELIEVDDDPPYPPLNSTSLVLEESRIGVDRLPVVDDDLSTPLVEEYAPYDDTHLYHHQHQQQHYYQTYVSDSTTYPNQYHPHQYQVSTGLPAEFSTGSPITPLVHPDTLPYETEYPEQVIPSASSPLALNRVPSRMSIDSSLSDDIIVEAEPVLLVPLSAQEQEIPPTTSAESAEPESERNTTLNRSFTITKGPAPKEHAQRKSPHTEKPESLPKKEEKKERPKKPRPPSIRELQNAPVPMRPPKPKPPSKSQLMMEQLKASIEADKHKPKKDIKSKLHDLLSAPPPQLPSTRRTQSPTTAVDENQEEKMSPNGGGGEAKKITPAASSSSPNAKRRRNEPLKAVNSRIRSSTPQQAGDTTTVTTRTPAKPRQTLLPPKTIPKGPLTLRNEKMKKEAAEKQNLAGGGCLKAVPQSPVTSTRPRLPRSGLPTTSSTHPPVNSIRKTSKPSTSMATKPQQRDETLKLKRLTDAVRGFDVMAVVFGQQVAKYDEELRAALRQNSKLESHVATLEAKYEQLLGALNAEHNRQIEHMNRSHEDELNSVKERYEKQLAECKDESMRILDEQRCIHEAEIERLSRSNQIQCANLDSKLAEAERTVEELIRDKKNLEATLSKDTNEKVAELSKEISSLNTALEIKSTEIKTLRHLNAKLQLKVEEIPPKDIEISKLKHRVRELKVLVDQKTNTEKVLTSKFEELQRSARNQAVMSESMLKENDLLRYKIEEMESSTSEGEPNTAKTDSAVKYRTPQPMNVRSSSRLCQSERRPSAIPSSTTPQRFSQPQIGDDVMTRSVVSLYLEQGRNRSSKANIDTIYTPEGTFIAKGRGFSRRLSFDDAHDADDEGTPRLTRSNGHSSSTKDAGGECNGAAAGTAATAGTVTDSGISV